MDFVDVGHDEIQRPNLQYRKKDTALRLDNHLRHSIHQKNLPHQNFDDRGTPDPVRVMAKAPGTDTQAGESIGEFEAAKAIGSKTVKTTEETREGGGEKE